jgi:polyferredoxin
MSKKSKIPNIAILRSLIQLIFFVLLPGLYASAFLDIKTVFQGILEHDFSLTQSFPQLINALAIIPATLLLGRFFCGWMCAFGTLGDLLYYLSHKVFKIRYKMGEEADSALKYIKYALFLFIFIAVWGIQAFNISVLSPWDAFGSLLTFTDLPDFSYVITEVTVGFLLLLAIMTGSLFVERFFCRYLCPLGAVFSILSHLKFVRIKKPLKDCGSCRACTKKCSMGIPLYQMNSVTSGECINCMKCVTVCPRNNVHAIVAATAANPALAGALAVTAMAGVYYIGTFISEADTSTQVSSITAQAALEDTDSSTDEADEDTGLASGSVYTDGVYEGSANGFRRGVTTVSVTIANDTITNIEIVSHGDDAPFFNRACDTIISDIMDAQGTDVDTVSGATFSSSGIINAVADALSSAEIS